MKHTAIFIH